MERDRVNDDSPGQSESLKVRREVRRGPPVGRHVAAVAVVLVLMLVFWEVHRESGEALVGHFWNKVLADTSFVLLCLILTLGAVSRFVPRLRRLVPWNRELGIGMFVTAGLHVMIVLDYMLVDQYYASRGVLGRGTVFSFEGVSDALFGPSGWVTGDDLLAAANWVGLFALGYALVLAATSNDFSQRLLGRGWKFTQRQTYTLFVLTWLHTAAFLVYLDTFTPAFTWFWVFTILAVVTQVSGFVHTVRSPRGPSPQRAPKKSRPATSKAATVTALRWVTVTALWGLLIIGAFQMGLY
jgi:DMSO/TMAO reductase YedYZ heme-binding membrane subunit